MLRSALLALAPLAGLVLSATPARAAACSSTVGTHVTNTGTYIRRNGRPPNGMSFGTYANTSTPKLPETRTLGDGGTRDITYRECDIYPLRRGTNRGQERIVLGNDGKLYYTANHYGSFCTL